MKLKTFFCICIFLLKVELINILPVLFSVFFFSFILRFVFFSFSFFHSDECSSIHFIQLFQKIKETFCSLFFCRFWQCHLEYLIIKIAVSISANDHLIEFHLIEIVIFQLIEISLITRSNFLTLFTWSKVLIMNSVKRLNLGVWPNYSIKCQNPSVLFSQLIESSNNGILGF